MTREQMIKAIKAMRPDDHDIDLVLWSLSTEAIKATYKLELKRVDNMIIEKAAEVGA